jgi:Biotin-lipoyl like
VTQKLFAAGNGQRYTHDRVFLGMRTIAFSVMGGVVKDVYCTSGQMVANGQVLVALKTNQ